MQTHRTVKDLLADEPEFVLVSVPWPAAPAVTIELAGHGVPVLSETPPAPDLPGLRELWAAWGQRARPGRRAVPADAGPRGPVAVVRAGTIGAPTSVQVSSTHLYHAVSMIRGMLGVGSTGRGDARAFSAPLADPLSPEGWTGDATRRRPRPRSPPSTSAARWGLYDFTDNQWWNPLRTDRIVIRGSHGEIVDDRVIRLVEPMTVVESRWSAARPAST